MVLLFSNVVQMWLSMHSAPVICLYAFRRFTSIDNNGGANSHAPCVVGVSQALRSPQAGIGVQARACACERERIHDPPPPDYTRSRSPQAAHVDHSSRVLSPSRAVRLAYKQVHVCVRARVSAREKTRMPNSVGLAVGEHAITVQWCERDPSAADDRKLVRV